MSSVQQLLTAIDAVKSANPQAKVTVTVLPSQVTRKRKALIWYTQSAMTLNYIHTGQHSIKRKPRYSHTVPNTNTMTKEVMIGMLKQGANGNEILQILEVLASNSDAPQPTLKELTFW